MQKCLQFSGTKQLLFRSLWATARKRLKIKSDSANNVTGEQLPPEFFDVRIQDFKRQKNTTAKHSGVIMTGL
jgi:hypothetical protein